MDTRAHEPWKHRQPRLHIRLVYRIWSSGRQGETKCKQPSIAILRRGTLSFAAPVVGLPGLFPPVFDKHANRVITFAERIQECFLRSENGRPLPCDGPE